MISLVTTVTPTGSLATGEIVVPIDGWIVAAFINVRQGGSEGPSAILTTEQRSNTNAVNSPSGTGILAAIHMSHFTANATDTSRIDSPNQGHVFFSPLAVQVRAGQKVFLQQTSSSATVIGGVFLSENPPFFLPRNNRKSGHVAKLSEPPTLLATAAKALNTRALTGGQAVEAALDVIGEMLNALQNIVEESRLWLSPLDIAQQNYPIDGSKAYDLLSIWSTGGWKALIPELGFIGRGDASGGVDKRDIAAALKLSATDHAVKSVLERLLPQDSPRRTTWIKYRKRILLENRE